MIIDSEKPINILYFDINRIPLVDKSKKTLLFSNLELNIVNIAKAIRENRNICGFIITDNYTLAKQKWSTYKDKTSSFLEGFTNINNQKINGLINYEFPDQENHFENTTQYIGKDNKKIIFLQRKLKEYNEILTLCSPKYIIVSSDTIFKLRKKYLLL